MYTIAFYFTVTTITTVGYGDISGHNSTERCICIVMMICGVVLFSLISSSITQIIQNYDKVDEKEVEIKSVLDKIQQKYNLPLSLYSSLLHEIKKQVTHDEEDINYFINNLPIQIKNKVTAIIYERNYRLIRFLQNKPQFFINWIQPILLRKQCKQDDFLFVENDEIEQISFLFKGAAGYVI